MSVPSDGIVTSDVELKRLALHKAAELGFDGVMLGAKRPHLSVLDYGPASLLELRRTILDAGLRHVLIAGYTNFTADAEQFGRWRIIGLTPLQPVAVRLRGGGESLYEVDVSALRPGEHRFVELRLDQAGKDLRVRVLSPEGAPLKKAQVQVVHRLLG